MNNSLLIENRDSINLKNDSILNESVKGAQEEIKENRKFIQYVFRTLNHKKNMQSDVLHKECVEILRNRDNITKIVDEDNNNCKK
jgi:hypothetical protein